MLRILFIPLLLSLTACAQDGPILLQDYNFPLTDGEVKTLRQQNDTLYELKCYIDQPCQPRPGKHYKIISSRKTGEFTILKVERLDSIPLSTEPFPAIRYSVLVIKGVGDQQMGYLELFVGLTKSQLDELQVDVKSLENKFFFSFFSDTYLKEMATWKKVETRSDALEIMKEPENEKLRPVLESYAQTDTRDMYGAGLSAEILNRICIDKGYNPIGAGRAINSLLK